MFTQITVECDGNKYGQDCHYTCGDCHNGDQCNHVNGSCLGGCNAGMSGEKCDEGNWVTRYMLNVSSGALSKNII